MDWKRLFDSLGLNGTRWQWRILRWQSQWKEARSNLWGKNQHVSYPHKFCRNCGALLDRNASVCLQCEGKVESWRRQSLTRAIGLVMPSASISTPVLIVINIGIMIMMMLRYGGQFAFTQNPEEMRLMGCLVPALYQAGEQWRLITYGYLHYGLLHIGFNMLALSQVGPMLENEVGSARFFTVYTLTLVAGGAADLLIRTNPFIHVAGASGALFGLIGFGITYCHFSAGYLKDHFRGFFIKWGIYGFVFGYAIGADNIAHGGGFLAGAILGVLIERERRQPERLAVLWQVLAMLCLAATVGAFVWMLKEGGGQTLEALPLQAVL